MDSNDDREDIEGSRPLSDAELARQSKVSPHLRAQMMDWKQRRDEARRAGHAPLPAPVVAVIIELKAPNTSELERSGVDFEHLIGVLCAAKVPLDRLERLADLDSILRIHHEREPKPALDDSIPEIEANRARNPQFPFSGAEKYTGQGVVVGIIDSGINCLHPVFALPNNPTKSRILALLDQTVDPPATYTQAQIEAAIASNTQLIQPGRIVNGTRVETSNSDHKHGTHVAGIAAGNGKIAGNCSGEFTYVGVAPEAGLVIVKYAFDGGTANLLKAIQFIADTAGAVSPDGLPCVINMSFGEPLGPHDGSDPMDKMIDAYLLARSVLPGPVKPVVLVATAGNRGGHQTSLLRFAEGEDSHATGDIPPGGVIKRLRYQVPPEIETDPKGEHFTRAEIRYTAAIGLGCRLIPPGNNITGSNLAAPNGSVTFVENTQGSTCRILSNIEPGPPANRRRIYIEVKSAAGKLNQRGEWVIELTNAGAAAIPYHTWITGPQYERFKDDVSRANTIGSPGNSTSVITVGNYSSTGKSKGQIADTSSRGPRLDGAQKPDIAAPGVDICSAKRDFHQGCCCDCCCDSYTDMTGTSMAAPHVTGAIALMLQRNPALTHQQIKGILMSNAFRDSYTGANPNNDFGNGKLRVLAVLNDPLVRGTGPALTAQVAPVGARIVASDVTGRTGAELPPLPKLVEGTPLWRLLGTAEGQKLYYRGLAHWDEARALVNGHRRIATVWHRNHGPLLMHHITRTVMLPHVALPREWEGEELSIRAARLVSALEPFASKDLIRAMHETLPLIAELQGKTLMDVVQMFEAAEAARAPGAGNAAQTDRVLEHA